MLTDDKCPWPFTRRTKDGQLVTEAPTAVFTEATAEIISEFYPPGISRPSFSEVLGRLELWSAQCWIIAGMGPSHRLWYELYLLASGAAWTLQLQSIAAAADQAAADQAAADQALTSTSEVVVHRTPSPLGWATLTIDGQETR